SENSILLDKTLNKNKKPLKDFQKRFEFIEYLRKRDQNLAALMENISFKKESSNLFHLFIPESFSFYKKKIEEKNFFKNLEKELKLFLNTSEEVNIGFSFYKEPLVSIREEKKSIEQSELLKQAKNNSFVNQVTHLFKGKIKSVKKIDKNKQEI
ncbi:MAG: hypothetical protein OXC37_00975, partial [Bdellovibrionaceae bacterium]|nr:hypothetical protein [Pseudobdellovibrionaceae bacterium]